MSNEDENRSKHSDRWWIPIIVTAITVVGTVIVALTGSCSTLIAEFLKFNAASTSGPIATGVPTSVAIIAPTTTPIPPTVTSTALPTATPFPPTVTSTPQPTTPAPKSPEPILPAPMEDLEEDAKTWKVFTEKSPTYILESVSAPSVSGKALRCAITGGDEANSNVQCYRNILQEPSANVFALTVHFRYGPVSTCNNQGTASVVQALEFTMSKWQQEKRYEFALQWQNVGVGAPQWRYWDPFHPQRWVPLKIQVDNPCLLGEQWHILTLEGYIRGGLVQYQSFTIDSKTYPLGFAVAPAVARGEEDRLAVGIQMDGNAFQKPYDVFIDKVGFSRKTVPETALVAQPTLAIQVTPTESPALCGDPGAIIGGKPVSASDWNPIDCSYGHSLNGATIKLTTWGLLLTYEGSTLREARIIKPGVTMDAPDSSALFAGFKTEEQVESSYQKSSPAGPTPVRP